MQRLDGYSLSFSSLGWKSPFVGIAQFDSAWRSREFVSSKGLKLAEQDTRTESLKSCQIPRFQEKIGDNGKFS